MTVVRCGQYKNILDERPDTRPEKRIPCPSCGSTSREFDVDFSSRLTIYSSIGIKAKRKSQKKPYVEEFSGVELWRKFKKLVRKYRTIDRDNDLYEEKVTELETDEIIHHCKEPLSTHKNHGTVKHEENHS